MIVGLGMMFSEGILLRLLIRYFTERQLLIGGLVVFAVALLILGTANDGWQLYAAVSLSLVYGVIQPALMTLVSNAVTARQQGIVQGQINSVKAIAEGLAPAFGGVAMMLFEDSAVPGCPFIACSGLVLAAAYTAHGLAPDAEAWQHVHEDQEPTDLQMDDEQTRIMTASGKCEIPQEQFEPSVYMHKEMKNQS